MLQDMGVGKRKDMAWGNTIVEPLSKRQFQNWIGSGKVSFSIENGQCLFDERHIEEVGRRYLDSNGRAYSVYFDKGSGEIREFVNSYQCSELWSVVDRQAQNIIASGKVPNSLKVGNEYYVGKQEAEQYREVLRLPVSVEPKHQDIR